MINDEESAIDRRRSRRFPLRYRVQCKLLRRGGGLQIIDDAETINISSSGVLFSSAAALGIGTLIEAAIAWPAVLNRKCALKLVIRGHIVRRDNTSCVVEYQDYEFKTLRSSNEIL